MRGLFPSKRYLCHLWPERAVERFNGPWDHVPTTPVLLVGNTVCVPNLRMNHVIDIGGNFLLVEPIKQLRRCESCSKADGQPFGSH